MFEPFEWGALEPLAMKRRVHEYLAVPIGGDPMALELTDHIGFVWPKPQLFHI
jgi:hypothetical protein